MFAYLFLRKKNNSDVISTENSVIKKDSLISASLLSEFFDLENNHDAFVSTEKHFSGKQSCMLSSIMEYGVSISKKIGDIPASNNLKSISLLFKCLNGAENPDALYVLSIDDDKGKSVFWAGEPVVCKSNKDWSETTITFLVPPEFLKPEYKITIYPWNRNKKEFYIDDIHVNYIGTAIYKNEASSQSEIANLFFDFETDAGMQGADNVKETTAHSGKKACDLSGGKEYGPSINKKMSEFGSPLLKKISLSVWIYPLTDNPNTVLVASVVNSKNETVFWEGKSSKDLDFQKNKWTKINASCNLPVEKITSQDILGVSVWNKGKTDVIIDDLEIVYGDAPERRGSPSTIDATSIYEKRFVSEKNKPPYKTIYFEKQEIKNGNGIEQFEPGDKFLVGNFADDKNKLDEILCIGKNRQALFSYDSSLKQFKKLWENTTATNPLWKHTNDFLVNITTTRAAVLFASKICIRFNGTKWIQEPAQKLAISVQEYTQGNESIYPGCFTSDKQQLLKLNRSWRFDLKLEENNVIIGNVDFKGYPDDHNPKYYEFVTLVSGHFLNSKRNSILVIMANCADSNFDGVKCNTLENLNYLPNCTQLYSIMK